MSTDKYMYYTPNSKYYEIEETFRSIYPNARIENHANDWKHATPKDSDVIACRLLGYQGGYGKPSNKNRLWIVARKEKQTI